MRFHVDAGSKMNESTPIIGIDRPGARAVRAAKGGFRDIDGRPDVAVSRWGGSRLAVLFFFMLARLLFFTDRPDLPARKPSKSPIRGTDVQKMLSDSITTAFFHVLPRAHAPPARLPA